MNYVHETRGRFLRLLVLVRWASQSNHLVQTQVSEHPDPRPDDAGGKPGGKGGGGGGRREEGGVWLAAKPSCAIVSPNPRT